MREVDAGERDAGEVRVVQVGVAEIVSTHRYPVEILAVQGLRILVSNLEALDATPVLDIKPVLDTITER